MAAPILVRGTAGKSSAAGNITIAQADYTTAPQVGDQIYAFHVIKNTPTSTTDPNVNNAIPQGFDLFPNGPQDPWLLVFEGGYLLDDATPQNVVFQYQVLMRVATGTSADNVTWFAAGLTGSLETVIVSHVVFRNLPGVDVAFDYQESLRGTDAYSDGWISNKMKFNPGLGADTTGNALTTATSQTSNLPMGSFLGGLQNFVYEGQTAWPGTNLISMFMAPQTYGSTISYSGLSSSMTMLTNSTNGLVVAGEYVDGTVAATARQLTWASATPTYTFSMCLPVPPPAGIVTGGVKNRTSVNRAF